MRLTTPLIRLASAKPNGPPYNHFSTIPQLTQHWTYSIIPVEPVICPDRFDDHLRHHITKSSSVLSASERLSNHSLPVIDHDDHLLVKILSSLERVLRAVDDECAVEAVGECVAVVGVIPVGKLPLQMQDVVAFVPQKQTTDQNVPYCPLSVNS